MKQILFTLLIVGCAAGLQAQALAQPNQASTSTSVRETISLKETAFDFGKIQQGRPVTHIFMVDNIGSDTLQVQNVQASCGCTTPVWKKDPVAPGTSTEITVGYNAASEGLFEKLVTIYYNGGQTKIITIKGNVYKMPSTPAPLNSSVQLLKQTNH